MARSERRLCNGLTIRWRRWGLNYDTGGSCHQDGALDPLQEKHHNRASCKIILAACGKIVRSPSSHPYQLGCPIVGRWWCEIWLLLGTKLKYGTAYNPQSQGQVERMNAIISQTLRCLMSDVIDLGRWREFLPAVEMVVNSLPNRSTGYSPFYFMYGYHPVLLVELLKGDESTNVETLAKFLETT